MRTRRLAWGIPLFVLTSSLVLPFAPAAAAPDGGERVDPDLRVIGRRFKFKVESAGLPDVEGGERLDIRTEYALSRDGVEVARNFVGRWVYVDDVGVYTLSWNGFQQPVRLRLPDGWDRARCRELWNRGEPVEVTSESGALVLPTVWVSHAAEVGGPHNDVFTIIRSVEHANAIRQEVVRTGVAVMYGPDRVSIVDDGTCWANTLIHLAPGDYFLAINGTSLRFSLGAGEARHIRLGAVSVQTTEAQFFLRSETQGGAGDHHDSARMLVVAPGRYRIDNWADADVPPGQLITIESRGPGGVHLGVRGRAVPDGGGVEVTGISEGSAAARAGIAVRDVIVAVGDAPVRTMRDLVGAVGRMAPGSAVEMTIRRGGSETRVTVRFGS